MPRSPAARGRVRGGRSCVSVRNGGGWLRRLLYTGNRERQLLWMRLGAFLYGDGVSKVIKHTNKRTRSFLYA